MDIIHLMIMVYYLKFNNKLKWWFKLKKKIIIKYSVLVVFILAYFFIMPINRFCNKEINLSLVNYVFGKSLYNDRAVVNDYTEVIDYYIENDFLYIFPIEGEVKLPMDVSIAKISSEVIEVIDTDSRYYIYNIDKRKKALYQYVYSNEILGYTDDYYIIKSNNIDYIAKKLIINYEAV